MSLQQISEEIATKQPGENVSNLTQGHTHAPPDGCIAVLGLDPALWLGQGAEDPWVHWHSLTPGDTDFGKKTP
eukprot:3311022-Prorocentrum_lima.AAC.1